MAFDLLAAKPLGMMFDVLVDYQNFNLENNVLVIQTFILYFFPVTISHKYDINDN